MKTQTGYLQTQALKIIERISKAMNEDECDEQIEWSTEEPLNDEEYTRKVTNYILDFLPFGIVKQLRHSLK